MHVLHIDLIKSFFNPELKTKELEYTGIRNYYSFRDSLINGSGSIFYKQRNFQGFDFLKSPLEKNFSMKQYISIKKYLLPISLILSLESPCFLFVHELETIV